MEVFVILNIFKGVEYSKDKYYSIECEGKGELNKKYISNKLRIIHFNNKLVRVYLNNGASTNGVLYAENKIERKYGEWFDYDKVYVEVNTSIGLKRVKPCEIKAIKFLN